MGRIEKHHEKWDTVFKQVLEEATDTIKKRRKRRILLHMGLLTPEYGLNFGELSFSGGPLGELVQWADLIGILYVLGHDLTLSWNSARLSSVVKPQWNECKHGRIADIMYTDLHGLSQLQSALSTVAK